MNPENATQDLATPAIVDRATWERARADLMQREKAHTRAGDALAAARRRLPMTRMGPVTRPDEAGMWWRRRGRPVAQWTRTDAPVQ